MASPQSLEALQAATRALQTIQRELQPVWNTLTAASSITNPDDESTTPVYSPSQVALAQTALALTLGTLRFLRPRLLVQSQPPQLPAVAATVQADAATAATAQAAVRSELNRIRKLLVTLQKTDAPIDTKARAVVTDTAAFSSAKRKRDPDDSDEPEQDDDQPLATNETSTAMLAATTDALSKPAERQNSVAPQERRPRHSHSTHTKSKKAQKQSRGKRRKA